MKAEKRAVLAQSSFRRFHTIGRMPDSGKAKLSHCTANKPVRSGKKRAVLAQSAFRRFHTIGRMPDSGKAKLSRGTANKPVKSGKKRAVLAQRLEENYDRNLLREVI